MEFGLLKSKIEKKLSESYLNNTFKRELQTFKKIVLENDAFSKAFHIYNELSESKGYEDRFAEDFIEECVDLYNRLEVDRKSLFMLTEWVRSVESTNNYKTIDNLLNKDSVIIEERIKSKSTILENLKKKKEEKKFIDLPINKMIDIANNNIKNHLNNLSESEIKEFKKYTSYSQKELEKRYEIISEMTIEKLESLTNNSDSETKKKIDETVKKIKTQKVDVLNYVKLKTLNENL